MTDTSWHLAVGISLALLSGFFIGTSLILQKKGLLQSKSDSIEGGLNKSYLKYPIWWIGMSSMALGEICNFGAYAFAPTVLVTPLGAISVVVSAILSVFFLNEKLNFSGTAGICLCIIGATMIVLHGPHSTATDRIPDFFTYVTAPGFISYAVLCLILLVYIIFYVAPRYGHVHPVVYISVTSIVGAFLVNGAQGLGSSIVYSASNWNTDNQFLYWQMYPLIVFVICAAVMQVDFLNRTLLHFSTSIVTPVYFVFFSTATLITSAILYQGFDVASTLDAISVVLGFLVIVIGVSLLFQYNLKLNKLKVKFIEDINDADNEEEDDDQANDQNPLRMMAESFPLSNRKNHRVVSPEPDVRGASEDNATASASNYVRQDQSTANTLGLTDPSGAQGNSGSSGLNGGRSDVGGVTSFVQSAMIPSIPITALAQQSNILNSDIIQQQQNTAGGLLQPPSSVGPSKSPTMDNGSFYVNMNPTQQAFGIQMEAAPITPAAQQQQTATPPPQTSNAVAPQQQQTTSSVEVRAPTFPITQSRINESVLVDDDDEEEIQEEIEGEDDELEPWPSSSDLNPNESSTSRSASMQPQQGLPQQHHIQISSTSSSPVSYSSPTRSPLSPTSAAAAGFPQLRPNNTLILGPPAVTTRHMITPGQKMEQYSDSQFKQMEMVSSPSQIRTHPVPQPNRAHTHLNIGSAYQTGSNEDGESEYTEESSSQIGDDRSASSQQHSNFSLAQYNIPGLTFRQGANGQNVVVPWRTAANGGVGLHQFQVPMSDLD